MLWYLLVVKLYLILLVESFNFVILEGFVGFLQNFFVGNWKFVVYIWVVVWKEKGFFIFVEFLRMDNDRVVFFVVIVLRNMVLDVCNKEFIGKYVM